MLRRSLPSTLLSSLVLGAALLVFPACGGGGDDGPQACQTDTDCLGEGEACHPTEKTCQVVDPTLCEFVSCVDGYACGPFTGRCEPSDWCVILDMDEGGEDACEPGWTCESRPQEQTAVCVESDWCILDEVEGTCVAGEECVNHPETRSAACEVTDWCVYDSVECQQGYECLPDTGKCVKKAQCEVDADCGSADLVCDAERQCVAKTACLDGGVCAPDKYQDESPGDHDTSSYKTLYLKTTSGTTVARAGGNALRYSGVADGSPTYWWLINEMDPQLALVDVARGGVVPVAPVYVFVDPAGNRVGHPVLGFAPYGSGHSPVLQVVLVKTVEGYPANAIKSKATLDEARFDMETGIVLEYTNELWAVQFVDPTVGLESATATAGSPEWTRFWVDTEMVYGWRLPGAAPSGGLPLASESADPAATPPTPAVPRMWMFKYGLPCGYAHVRFEVPHGDPAYSPVVAYEVLEIVDDQTYSCSQLPTTVAEIEAGLAAGDLAPAGSPLHILAPQAP